MNSPSTGEVAIERGSILIYRAFDVAEAIDLEALETNARAAAGTSRLRITRQGGQALIIRNAPVTLALGEQDLTIAGVTHRCDVQARAWDYGVISLQFRLPIPRGTPWSALTRLAAGIENDADVEGVARQRLDALIGVLGDAVHERHHWTGSEDYVIHFFEELDGIADVAELPDRVDIAALLLGEATQPLAARTRAAVTDIRHQYWAGDLTIIDWNSALVVEPNGARDVPDVIEFALTHLLELRYYDDLLDVRLRDLYAAVSRSGRSFRTNFARLSRDASSLFMDISEFIERVENSLKVIGDFYLATIFRAAVKRLRLQEWEENLTRKLGLLARTSELLSAQATAHRSHLLEWIVILLIAFEVVWALVGH